MDTSPLPNLLPRQDAAALGLVVMVVRALALMQVAPAAIIVAQELVLEGAAASPVLANAATTATATKAQLESETKTSAHRNLQVLPAEITADALLDVMLANLHGLGLPRRAGEGCLYCHVGSLEISRSQWDYASDANPKKAKARAMMTMVREINQRHLASLEHRLDSELTVTCHTCHAGRTDPSPLPDLLLRRYRDGGIQALETAYRQAREEYFAAGVYDFRASTLADVAVQLRENGSAEDGLRVHQLNVEHTVGQTRITALAPL